MNSTASTLFNDAGVTNGTQYFYKVSAVNGMGEGSLSTEVSATPAVPPASKPAAPVVTATAGNTTVALAWAAPANNGSPITSYNIYRATTSGQELLLTSTSSLSFTDTGRTNGVTYFYKVTAVNGIGEGPLSSEVSATPSAPTGPFPGVPVLTATAGNGVAHLSWPVPSPGTSPLIYYYIYRSTTSGTEIWYSYTFGTTFDDASALRAR